MSKSLGNVIDPVEIFDLYGADALRFSLARLATGGQQDIPLVRGLDPRAGAASRTRSGTRRGSSSRLFPGGEPHLPPEERLTAPQRWLLARHQRCVAEVNAVARIDYRVRRSLASDVSVLLVGVLRLGARDGEGATPIERRCRRRGRGERPRLDPRTDAPAAPPGDAVRHGGDLATLRGGRDDRASPVARGGCVRRPRGAGGRRRGRLAVRRGSRHHRASLPQRAPDPAEDPDRGSPGAPGGEREPVRRFRAGRSSIWPARRASSS